MGLFQNKHHAGKKSQDEQTAEAVTDIFDDDFRKEMRSFGREYFKRVIEDNAASFKRDLDATVSQMNAELKQYMTEQLDATIASFNQEIKAQLDTRLEENDRLARDAQDLAVQSLNRNAQALHDKYQQLVQALEQTLAAQEATMIGVFEENKAMMTNAQNDQEAILKSLEQSAKTSGEQAKTVSERLEKTITEQETALAAVFEQSKARMGQTEAAQKAALKTLEDSAKTLQENYRQLNDTLQKNVAEQEEVLIGAFQNNMAQVIEHYLMGALGEQYDMKAQLPMIIKQMETNKQTIMDDMKL